MGILVQVLCTAVVSFLSIGVGVMFTWPSSTFRLFGSENTTLHRPMTNGELALFGSLSSIGALISTPFAGYALARIGRKYTAIASSLTYVVSWTMIVLSRRVEVILAAIFFSGVGGAVVLVVPVFVSEFCQESIRGSMTSSSMMFYAMGMLISYTLGGLLSYYNMLYVCLAMSIIAVLLLLVLKESPMFLMLKGAEQEAAKSIAFYRSIAADSKEVLEEMNTMRRALNPDLDDSPGFEEEKLNPQKLKQEKLSILQFLKKSRSTRKALFVVFVLCTTSIFQGLVVLQVYAEPLFQKAVPNWSSTLCSILLALVTVVSGSLAAYLIDAAGRRYLMICSSAADAVCCVILGTQIHLHWGPHWLTALTIYVFCAVYTLGAGTVPFVLIAEVFLPEIKSFVSTLSIEWIWLCNFIILLIFNPLVKAIGLGPVFYIFAAICAGSAVFTYIFLPETKGLAVDEIQGLFVKKRRGQAV